MKYEGNKSTVSYVFYAEFTKTDDTLTFFVFAITEMHDSSTVLVTRISKMTNTPMVFVWSVFGSQGKDVVRMRDRITAGTV